MAVAAPSRVFNSPSIPAPEVGAEPAGQPCESDVLEPRAAPAAVLQLAPQAAVPASLDTAALLQLIHEVAPQVEAATGARLDLTRLQVVEANTAQLKGIMLADLRARSGVPDSVWSAVEEHQNKKIGAANTVVGWFAASSQSLVLVPQNFPSINGDKLRLTLFKLLVMATQQQQYPDYMDALNAADGTALMSEAENGLKCTESRVLKRVADGRKGWLLGQVEVLAKRAKDEHFTAADQMFTVRHHVLRTLSVTRSPSWKKVALKANAPKAYEALEARGEVPHCFANPQQVDRLMQGCLSLRFDPHGNLPADPA